MTKQVARMFLNWTNQDFSHKWDNVSYTFKAGESTYLQDYLADHFAKHLAQREINRAKLLMTDRKYQEFYNKCFSGQSIEAESELKLNMKVEETKENTVKPEVAEEVESIKKKPGRPKKIKPEDEFAGK